MKVEIYRSVAALPAHEAQCTLESLLPALAKWMSAENRTLTRTVGQTVTNRHALLVGHSAAAFLALCGSPSLGVSAAVVCLLWFAATLYLCRKGGLK